MLTGIVTMKNIFKSTNILTCWGPEQQPATLQPLIADILLIYGDKIYWCNRELI